MSRKDVEILGSYNTTPSKDIFQIMLIIYFIPHTLFLLKKIRKKRPFALRERERERVLSPFSPLKKQEFMEDVKIYK